MRVTILELVTEEESVLTLIELLSNRADCDVSLILSSHVHSLISLHLDRAPLVSLLVLKGGRMSHRVAAQVRREIRRVDAQVLVCPRFSCVSPIEALRYRRIFGTTRTCVGAFSYARWMQPVPPIRWGGRFGLRLADIGEWASARVVFGRITGFFVSDIRRGYRNPLTRGLQRRRKWAFEIPFKLPNGPYQPVALTDDLRFVIPGKIDGTRRDYLGVLRCFRELKQYRWTLHLLGRPVGRYGRKVVRAVTQLNREFGAERIEMEQAYLAKEYFDAKMAASTHVLAPVTVRGYEKGKDTGALYDVFKYNKFGVFAERYFYDLQGPEVRCLLTYTDLHSLRAMICRLVRGEQEYASFHAAWAAINEYLDRERIAQHVMGNLSRLAAAAV